MDARHRVILVSKVSKSVTCIKKSEASPLIKKFLTRLPGPIKELDKIRREEYLLHLLQNQVSECGCGLRLAFGVPTKVSWYQCKQSPVLLCLVLKKNS